ncbi:hypothetical protein, partial [Actinomadura verrucosospora]|uniref:hypothetical protein n=1 Tax=Actinomadura verrucosospora TaxID=46165 RepID=UPI0031E69B93
MASATGHGDARARGTAERRVRAQPQAAATAAVTARPGSPAIQTPLRGTTIQYCSSPGTLRTCEGVRTA